MEARHLLFEREFSNGTRLEVVETGGDVVARAFRDDGCLYLSHLFSNVTEALLAALVWDGLGCPFSGSQGYETPRS